MTKNRERERVREPERFGKKMTIIAIDNYERSIIEKEKYTTREREREKAREIDERERKECEKERCYKTPPCILAQLFY